MARNQFGRPRPKKKLGKKFVIVCEGSKTEVGYFQAIRRELRQSTLQVIVVHPNATDPKNIVQAAIDLRQSQIDDDGWMKEDAAWAVFDGEEHMRANLRNWNSAIELARKENIELAISNPSFELWYLIHFADQSANISRVNVLRELKKHIPKYSKNDILFPEPLQAFMTDATTRAKTLEERINQNFQPVYTNPSTGVYVLVEDLRSL